MYIRTFFVVGPGPDGLVIPARPALRHAAGSGPRGHGHTHSHHHDRGQRRSHDTPHRLKHTISIICICSGVMSNGELLGCHVTRIHYLLAQKFP